MNEQPQPQIQVTLRDLIEIKCEKCQGTVFNDGMLLRKASSLVTGQPRDAYVPIPVFVCSSCGSVNDEFIPRELKSKIIP